MTARHLIAPSAIELQRIDSIFSAAYADSRVPLALSDNDRARMDRDNSDMVRKVLAGMGEVWVAGEDASIDAVMLLFVPQHKRKTPPQGKDVHEGFPAQSQRCLDWIENRWMPFLRSWQSGPIAREVVADYYFIPLIGTAPEAQQRGLGRLLVDQAIMAADGEQTGIWLNALDDGPKRLYSKAGFDVVKKEELNLPDGTPVECWAMIKAPTK